MHPLPGLAGGHAARLVEEARKEEQDHVITLHQASVENPALVTLKRLPTATLIPARVRIAYYFSIYTKYWTILSTLGYSYIRVFLNMATKFFRRFSLLLAEDVIGDHVWLALQSNIDYQSPGASLTD